MQGSIRREDGLTIIEVLVAAVVLVLGSMATFGVLRAAVGNTQRAKATQIALDRAQQELEALRSLSNEELALTANPPNSTDSLNPDYRVSGGEFALLKGPPPSEYKNLVVNGGSLYGGGFIGSGVVSPGPTSFTSGGVSGKVYRYVVWRNDASCPEATCPGTQDYKQIVVAVKLNKPDNESSERGYVEVQSNFIDPKDSALSDPIPGASGVVTAQQFFLSDTPCSPGGTTAREEITADHPLHNTLGTCASEPKTNAEQGPPDALLLGAPPDPDPLDPNNPSLYDYSNDYSGQPTPETAKGIQLRRDDTNGCHYVPAGTTAPQWQVHRWVTDPMSSSFAMNGNGTLDFFTRTLSDASYTSTLCIYLFDRHEEGSPPTATDTMLVNKEKGTPYWEYNPVKETGGFWWKNSWKEVRVPLTFAAKTLPIGDRLGVALSVERGNTPSEPGAIAILFDHPNYRSRVEIETNTPIEGG